MGIFATGEVVLVPFPFSDLSQTKVRPALCVANLGRGDWVLCQITSNAYGDPMSQPIVAGDFDSGGLLVPSFVRPGKLFTADDKIVLRSLGKLSKPRLQVIL